MNVRFIDAGADQKYHHTTYSKFTYLSANPLRKHGAEVHGFMAYLKYNLNFPRNCNYEKCTVVIDTSISCDEDRQSSRSQPCT